MGKSPRKGGRVHMDPTLNEVQNFPHECPFAFIVQNSSQSYDHAQLQVKLGHVFFMSTYSASKKIKEIPPSPKASKQEKKNKWERREGRGNSITTESKTVCIRGQEVSSIPLAKIHIAKGILDVYTDSSLMVKTNPTTWKRHVHMPIPSLARFCL